MSLPTLSVSGSSVVKLTSKKKSFIENKTHRNHSFIDKTEFYGENKLIVFEANRVFKYECAYYRHMCNCACTRCECFFVSHSSRRWFWITARVQNSPNKFYATIIIIIAITYDNVECGNQHTNSLPIHSYTHTHTLIQKIYILLSLYQCTVYRPHSVAQSKAFIRKQKNEKFNNTFDRVLKHTKKCEWNDNNNSNNNKEKQLNWITLFEFATDLFHFYMVHNFIYYSCWVLHKQWWTLEQKIAYKHCLHGRWYTIHEATRYEKCKENLPWNDCRFHKDWLKTFCWGEWPNCLFLSVPRRCDASFWHLYSSYYLFEIFEFAIGCGAPIKSYLKHGSLHQFSSNIQKR